MNEKIINIALWIVGVLLIVGGLNSFSKSILGGIFLLLSGIVLLPLIQNTVSSKMKRIIKVRWFALISFILLAFAGLILNSADVRPSNDNNKIVPQDARSSKPATIQATAAEIEAKKNEIAREFMQKYLKDPSSSEFRNQKGFCGEVNSKNSFGGYSGYKRFIAADQNTVVIEGEGVISDHEFNEIWNTSCK